MANKINVYSTSNYVNSQIKLHNSCFIGKILLNIQRDLGLTNAMMAKQLSISSKRLNNIISGESLLTEELIETLSRKYLIINKYKKTLYSELTTTRKTNMKK